MTRRRKPLYYQRRLLAAAPELATMRGVLHAEVLHDNDCEIFQRRFCNCVPDISIISVNGGSVLVIDAQGKMRKANRQ
jgi:hypothetical protein